jgi:hypothetical protein
MLLPYMKAFGEFLTDYFRSHWPGYDVVHANFFMSGLACLPATRECGMPLVVTFHALDRVRASTRAGRTNFLRHAMASSWAWCDMPTGSSPNARKTWTT